MVRSKENAESVEDLRKDEVVWLTFLLIIYKLFRINLKNLVKNKLFICKEYHIQPSEIDKFVYYEYEWILEEINILQKEQEKQNEKQQEDLDGMKKSMNFSTLMNGIGKNMPNMSNMKMPTVNVPKF